MMYTLIKKEIQSYFSSAIGYIVITTFVVINSVFLWIFQQGYNILDSGFADLYNFFELSPWILLFLIPAITMRSFAEEIKTGTLVILITKPISILQIILGKFIAAYLLVILCLVITSMYSYTVYQLGNPVGNISLGATFGGYLGLCGVALLYTSIGVLCSSLSQNQVVAYLLAVCLCFFFYYGFEGISLLEWNLNFIREWGIKSHLDNSNKGILDTRDMIYFASVSILMIIYTQQHIKRIYR